MSAKYLSAKYPNVLAIDYGRQRIGLAISRANLAEPLVILQNDAVFWHNLQEIVEAEQITQFVVGISENEMGSETQKFADELRLKFDLPVAIVDETLTSQEVRGKLKLLKKSKRTGGIDHYAAAEILTRWQELQNN